MGICTWCGSAYPKTRATRKYCSSRCKTNACLGRKPSRVRAADVQALYAMLEAEFPSVEAFRARLHSILKPHAPLPVLPAPDKPHVPRLD